MPSVLFFLTSLAFFTSLFVRLGQLLCRVTYLQFSFRGPFLSSLFYPFFSSLLFSFSTVSHSPVLIFSMDLPFEMIPFYIGKLLLI